VRRPGVAAAGGRAAIVALLLASLGFAGGAASPVSGQEARSPVRVDSISVTGNSQRVEAQSVVAVFGVQPGQMITARDVRRGIKALLATGLFRDIVVRASGTSSAHLTIEVSERPVIASVQIVGLEHGTSAREVRDTIGINPGAAYNPQRILDARRFILAELAEDGIPFAGIVERTLSVGEDTTQLSVVIEVTEGQRVTVAEVVFEGNERFSDAELVDAMASKPEGFWWFRQGSFEEADFALDLEERLPQFYASMGHLDFRVLGDTIVVDPATGKSRVVVEVEEGPSYTLGEFRVEGNRAFTTEELEGLLRTTEGGILSVIGLGGGEGGEVVGQTFDAMAFGEALATVEELYRNEGYLNVNVIPTVDKAPAENGEDPTVSASWIVNEGQPAVISRVSIAGNDYTHEWVIRNQLFVLPGDVYSQDRLLRSYQNISALGFFEAPLPVPEMQEDQNGDVNITFRVVEKSTGSINFGTSVGGGYGLSGFIGYQQPNLFGQAKSGDLRWDFGRYINSFEATYTDPAFLQSLVSGSISLFNSRDRFFQFASGRRRRIGASTRFGFPWPNSRVTRVFAGYGLSRTRYELFQDVDDTSLFGRPPGIQSQLTLGVTRQTHDHPIFPTVGSRQNVSAEINGGPLGGDGNFLRVLTDANWWVPVGGGMMEAGGGGLRMALGVTLRAGAVFGDAEAFPFDRFWMGGVQFGQQLRGYDETSITPLGYYGKGAAGISAIDRLGDAYYSMTAEYAFRLGGQIGVSVFFDAGNVWRGPSDFDLTRLYRGAGVGLSLVTPLGPIGIDYAYGFDKTVPGFQLHLKMGQGF